MWLVFMPGLGTRFSVDTWGWFIPQAARPPDTSCSWLEQSGSPPGWFRTGSLYILHTQQTCTAGGRKTWKNKI